MRVADSFVIYRSYIETARKFPKDKQLAFYDWLIDFAMYDIEPDFSAESPEMQFALDVVFGQIKASVSASISRYEACVENGRKGGAPKGNQNAKKNNLKQPDKQPKRQPKNNLNKNDNDNVNDNYNSLGVSEEGDLPSPPPPRTEKKKKELPKGWKPVVE